MQAALLQKQSFMHSITSTIKIGASKRAFQKPGQASCTEYFRSRPPSSDGFSKDSGRTADNGRNRPLFAILAQTGLFGTSLFRNFCFENGIQRKFNPASQGVSGNILCTMPDSTVTAGFSCVRRICLWQIIILLNRAVSDAKF